MPLCDGRAAGAAVVAVEDDDGREYLGVVVLIRVSMSRVPVCAASEVWLERGVPVACDTRHSTCCL